MADYVAAKKSGLSSCKIKTNTYRLERKFDIESDKDAYLSAFLSNHHSYDDDYF